MDYAVNTQNYRLSHQIRQKTYRSKLDRNMQIPTVFLHQIPSTERSPKANGPGFAKPVSCIQQQTGPYSQ